MVKSTISCFLIVVCLILAAASPARAGYVKPLTDTIPGNNKNADETNPKKTDEIIKTVPKARKQEKPIAIVAVPIQPVLVKPKIIVKPIIKLH